MQTLTKGGGYRDKQVQRSMGSSAGAEWLAPQSAYFSMTGDMLEQQYQPTIMSNSYTLTSALNQ